MSKLREKLEQRKIEERVERITQQLLEADARRTRANYARDASGGILLDPVKGTPIPAENESEVARVEALRRAPAHILDRLRQAGAAPSYEQMIATASGFEEVKASIVADGSGVTGTTEAVLIADGLNYTFPGGNGLDGLLAGSVIRIRAMGTITTTASPATLTWRLRYNSSGTAPASGVALATSSALTLTGSITNATFLIEFQVVVRGNPSTATSSITHGWFSCPSVAQTMVMIPATGPAAVNIDTTVPRVLQISATMGAATGTTATVQTHVVEWMR